MKLDNISLAYLLLELKPFLENAYLNKISEIKNGVLKIKVHSKQGSKDLILTKDGFFLTSFSLQARHGKSNFAISLRKELYNKRIVALEQHNLDRVVTIKFLEHSIVFEFLGGGNMALLDANGKILSCLKNETWADRQLKKGLQYEYPKNKSESPLKADKKTIIKVFEASKKDAIRTLFAALNISPLMAEEAFFLAKVDKLKKGAEIKGKELEKVLSRVKELYTVKKENLKPVLYEKGISPFPLKHLEEKPKEISSINSFLDETISHSMEKAKTLKEDKVQEEKVSGLEFQQKQQVVAREKFGKGIEDNRKKAELIYANFSEIEELRSAILSAMKKGLKEKEIMYTFKSAAKSGNRVASLIVNLDFSKKKFEVELD